MKRALVIMLVLMIAIATTITLHDKTIVAKATTRYVTLTINITGNGNLTVIIPNNSTVINESTTFKVPAGDPALILSNKSFWPGKGTVVTKIFLMYRITQNTTLNVYFNVSNVVYPSSEYARVTILNEGNLNLSIAIFNDTVIFTGFNIDNSSATFVAPINSTVEIYYGKEFCVNETLAGLFFNDYYYQYTINNSTPVILVATPAVNTMTTNSTTTTIITTMTTSTTTTTTLPSTTVVSIPVPNTTTTLTQHSETVSLISTITSRNNQSMIYIIIAIVVIVLVAYFVLRRVRK